MTTTAEISLSNFTHRGWVWWGGVISLAAYVYLCINSQQYGQAKLWQLLLVVAVCSVVSGVLWLQQQRGRLQLHWHQVLLFAVAFRLLGLFAYPVLEDDHFRYLWDGYMSVEMGGPYGIAPATFFASGEHLPERFDDILDGINYPHVPTVYGPTAQGVFALAYLLAPGQIWPLQLICVLADLLVLLLLRRLAPLPWCLLYAWCPLIIKEFSFTAHVDVIGAAGMLAALYMSRLRHVFIAGASLAVAAGVKPFALLAAPFLFGWRWRAWLALVTAMMLISVPFLSWQSVSWQSVAADGWQAGWRAVWLPAGLQVMADQWLFNAPLYLAALHWFSPAVLPGLRNTLMIGFALLWLLMSAWSVYQQRPGGMPTAQARVAPGALYCLFGLLLLCLPVLNPWYLVWWLVFACMRPALSPWVAAAMVMLSYVTGLNLGDQSLSLYQQPDWILVLEFSVIAGAVVFDSWRWFMRRPPAST